MRDDPTGTQTVSTQVVEERCLEATLEVMHDAAGHACEVTYEIAGRRGTDAALLSSEDQQGVYGHIDFAHGVMTARYSHAHFGDDDEQRTPMSYDAFVQHCIAAVRARMIEHLVFTHMRGKLDDAQRAEVRRYVEAHDPPFYANYPVRELVSRTIAEEATRADDEVTDAIAALDRFAAANTAPARWYPPASAAELTRATDALGCSLGPGLTRLYRRHAGVVAAALRPGGAALELFALDGWTRVRRLVFSPSGSSTRDLIVCGAATLLHGKKLVAGDLAFVPADRYMGDEVRVGHLHADSDGLWYLSPRDPILTLLVQLACAS